MAVLSPQHEKFAVELHRRLWRGEKQASARLAAYQFAGFALPPARPRKGRRRPDPGANARRLANSEGVKAKLKELASRATELASLDAGWLLVELKHEAEAVKKFNLDDYLGEPDADGYRYFDLRKVTREQIGMLVELQIESATEPGEDKDAPPRQIRKMKLKGPNKVPDRLAILRLIADIAGLKAPTKVAPTNPAGDGPPLAPEGGAMSDIEAVRQIIFTLNQAANAKEEAGE